MRRTAFTLPILISTFFQVGLARSDFVPEEEPLQLSPEMVEFLDQNFRRTLPPKERLDRLVSFVFNENHLGFTYSTETRTATDTFAARNGNCLSYTNMFIAMARHLGLRARFRESEIIPTWDQLGAIFTISQHINVAVELGPRWFLVDLYPEVGEIEIGGRVVSDERGLSHFYSNRAVEVLSTGDLQGAERYLQKALELDQTAAFLWTNLGVVRSQQGDAEGAEAAYRTALEHSPGHLPAVSNLASLYSRLGKKGLARRYGSKAARFRNRNPYYHYTLGARAWVSGDLDQALRHYSKAVKLKKEEHRFHFALARVYSRLGKSERALKHLEAARLYAPDESGRLRYDQKHRLLLTQSER